LSSPDFECVGPPPQKRKVTVILYVLAVLMFWTSLYLYLPTLPVYARTKCETLALVGVALSMYGLWQAVVRLPLGIAADWLGWKKPFTIAGFALAGLGAWGMGTADSAGGLIVGRAVTGLAAGTWVPIVVAFSSLFPPQESVRASALLTLVGSAGRILATGVNGTLNDLGGYPLAFFLAAAAGALGIALFLPVQERRRPSRAPSFSGIGRLIVRRDVLVPSLLSSIVQYANWTTTLSFMPLLARQVGASDVMISLLISMYFAVVTVGNLLATALARKMGAVRLAYSGFLLLCLGIANAAVAPNLGMIFIAQFFIGLSMGICYPVLMGMSIQHVVDRERNTAMGLHQSVYAVGMFSGPVLSGGIADMIGLRAMFGVTASVCLAAGLFGGRWLEDPTGDSAK
jgi:MFS family permease